MGPDGMWQVLAGDVARDAEVRPLAPGWDCDALAIGGRTVVKRPGHAAAAARLALVRPSVTLPVPEVHLVEGAPLWSWHVMLPEEPLLPQDHPALSKVAKAGFARDPGRFLAEVHRIPVAGARAAVDLSPWGGAGDVAALLPEGLRAAADGVVAQYAALPPDPCAAVFGQFAGHGWRRCAGACRGCIP